MQLWYQMAKYGYQIRGLQGLKNVKSVISKISTIKLKLNSAKFFYAIFSKPAKVLFAHQRMRLLTEYSRQILLK
jgi:hypothetical protein